MPIYGKLTVDLNGFIQFLLCDIEKKINIVIKNINDENYELDKLIISQNEPVAGFARVFGCWMRRRRHGAVSDSYFNFRVQQIHERIKEYDAKLKELYRLKNYVASPEFRESILGSCPICFDDFYDNLDTIIVPDCLHPVCHDCFQEILSKKTWTPNDQELNFMYKCPMCCLPNNSFYEVCFASSSKA